MHYQCPLISHCHATCELHHIYDLGSGRLCLQQALDFQIHQIY